MAAKKKPAAKFVIIRTYSAGVHVGELVSRKGKEVTLANAKRFWRWYGANTLNEIALRGVAANSNVSEAVGEIVLTEAIEVVTCAPAAVECFARATWGGK